jgi:hypothetical protein
MVEYLHDTPNPHTVAPYIENTLCVGGFATVLKEEDGQWLRATLLGLFGSPTQSEIRGN